MKRKIWRVEAYQPLPDLGPKFDVIAAHMICFNGHKSDKLWKIPEWEFFLDDLAANQLEPDGQVCLELNREYDNSLYTPELKEYFEARGAEIHTQRVLFIHCCARLPQLHKLLAEIGLSLPISCTTAGGALSTKEAFASFASTTRNSFSRRPISLSSRSRSAD